MFNMQEESKEPASQGIAKEVELLLDFLVTEVSFRSLMNEVEVSSSSSSSASPIPTTSSSTDSFGNSSYEPPSHSGSSSPSSEEGTSEKAGNVEAQENDHAATSPGEGDETTEAIGQVGGHKRREGEEKVLSRDSSFLIPNVILATKSRIGEDKETRDKAVEADNQPTQMYEEEILSTIALQLADEEMEDGSLDNRKMEDSSPLSSSPSPPQHKEQTDQETKERNENEAVIEEGHKTVEEQDIIIIPPDSLKKGKDVDESVTGSGLLSEAVWTETDPSPRRQAMEGEIEKMLSTHPLLPPPRTHFSFHQEDISHDEMGGSSSFLPPETERKRTTHQKDEKVEVLTNLRNELGEKLHDSKTSTHSGDSRDHHEKTEREVGNIHSQRHEEEDHDDDHHHRDRLDGRGESKGEEMKQNYPKVFSIQDTIHYDLPDEQEDYMDFENDEDEEKKEILLQPEVHQKKREKEEEGNFHEKPVDNTRKELPHDEQILASGDAVQVKGDGGGMTEGKRGESKDGDISVPSSKSSGPTRTPRQEGKDNDDDDDLEKKMNEKVKERTMEETRRYACREVTRRETGEGDIVASSLFGEEENDEIRERQPFKLREDGKTSYTFGETRQREGRGRLEQEIPEETTLKRTLTPSTEQNRMARGEFDESAKENAFPSSLIPYQSKRIQKSHMTQDDDNEASLPLQAVSASKYVCGTSGKRSIDQVFVNGEGDTYSLHLSDSDYDDNQGRKKVEGRHVRSKRNRGDQDDEDGDDNQSEKDEEDDEEGENRNVPSQSNVQLENMRRYIPPIENQDVRAPGLSRRTLLQARNPLHPYLYQVPYEP